MNKHQIIFCSIPCMAFVLYLSLIQLSTLPASLLGCVIIGYGIYKAAIILRDIERSNQWGRKIIGSISLTVLSVWMSIDGPYFVTLLSRPRVAGSIIAMITVTILCYGIWMCGFLIIMDEYDTPQGYVEQIKTGAGKLSLDCGDWACMGPVPDPKSFGRHQHAVYLMGYQLYGERPSFLGNGPVPVRMTNL